jgi:putative ABC transport system permease protein
MKTSEDVRISLRSLRRRPVESLLLVLGIALGIGATAAGISMISNSVDQRNMLLDSPQYREIVVQVREESEDMELAAVSTADGENVILSWEDLAAKRDVAEVEYAYLADPAVFRIANFNVGGPIGGGPEVARQSLESPDGPQPVLDEIAGVRVSPEYFDAWNLTTADGSVFTDEEMSNGSKVIVIGSALGETLFEDGQALGRELTIFQSLYRIVGILEPTGTSIDETGIIPAQVTDVGAIQVFARGMFGGGASLHFSVYDSTRLDEAKAQLSLWFEQQYGEGQVVVSIPREEVEAATDRTSRLVTVILFLAVAGLLIASVNVSNILLGRAMRRRRNVGILKALGATVQNVFTLFFLEAFVIGAAGAALGVGVSMLISSLMSSSMAGGEIVSATLFAGILAAWAITAALTLFPAVQASRIPAADALRYE